MHIFFLGSYFWFLGHSKGGGTVATIVNIFSGGEKLQIPVLIEKTFSFSLFGASDVLVE